MATTTESDFLETITLKQILNISEEVLDHAMGIAYQLYRAGRLTEAEIVCKGLIACDHRYWWSYSLYGAVLRQLGRDEEALVQVEKGLGYEPAQPKLLLMRSELRTTIDRKSQAAARSGDTKLSRPSATAPLAATGY